jgi:peptidoglycan-associated lipoprotein
MKLNQMIFPLVLALAGTLATTGCKHKPPMVTPIPGSQAALVGPDTSGNTLNQGGTLGDGTGGTGINTQQGGGNTTGLDEFEGMIKDPAALAAYTVHFSFDSSAIKPSEQSNISSVASALSANLSDKLLIEGNCDERGTEEYNRALGERRALAAREALAKAGIDPNRIRTISYGKDKPADPGHDDAAWAKNRRDDFILLHPKS